MIHTTGQTKAAAFRLNIESEAMLMQCIAGQDSTGL